MSLKCMYNSFKPVLYILCNSSECNLARELNRIYLCTVYTQTESCGNTPEYYHLNKSHFHNRKRDL